MKNKQKYTKIYKAESIQKHYLNYFIRKLGLEKENKSNSPIVQKVKERNLNYNVILMDLKTFLYLKHI